MRKNIFGRQLKRDSNERKALFKSLISSLILNERIKTTEAKAKAIKGSVDKIITKAKKGESYRRIIQASVVNDAAKKAIFDIAPRFADRQGGYSRIIRVGRRLSDNAEMVLMELVEGKKAESGKPILIESGLAIKNADKIENKVEENRKPPKKAASKSTKKAEKETK